MRALQVIVDCGTTRCFSEPGKPCPQMLTSNFGTQWKCGLFHDEEGQPLRLREDKPGGWLLRCKACLEADKGEV